jgi:hypothetical protein
VASLTEAVFEKKFQVPEKIPLSGAGVGTYGIATTGRGSGSGGVCVLLASRQPPRDLSTPVDSEQTMGSERRMVGRGAEMGWVGIRNEVRSPRVDLHWCLGRFPRSQARANSVAFASPRQSFAGAVAGRRVAIGRRA